jgi:hypothetical protein
VTDSDGRPVVGERVELATAGGAENGRVYLFGNVVRSTDDRGVYRIYGVPPGRFLVSVGVAADEARPMSIRPSSVSYYPKTYYPAAASEDAATPVEVAAGGEARGIDLVVGRRAKTYRARGRVVDAETGKPIANARIGYGKVMTNPDNSEWFAAMMVAYKSDAKGEFTMENFQPGRYAAFVASGTDKPWPWYGDPVPFEIADADADGVEIRLRRGARLSGVVVLEGADDPALRAKLASMSVWAKTEEPTSSGLRNPYSSSSEIGDGGAFEIGGVAPGSVSFGLGSWPRQKGFMMVRLERGVQQVGNIQVAAGDDVSDLRVVVGYGTGTIRGRVTAKEGELPANASAYVWLRRAGASTFAESTSADSRCRFLFDGLPPGDYDLQVDVTFKGGKMTRATKTVTVANGAETPVEIPVDLGDKGDGGER